MSQKPAVVPNFYPEVRDWILSKLGLANPIAFFNKKLEEITNQHGGKTLQDYAIDFMDAETVFSRVCLRVNKPEALHHDN